MGLGVVVRATRKMVGRKRAKFPPLVTPLLVAAAAVATACSAQAVSDNAAAAGRCDSGD